MVQAGLKKVLNFIAEAGLLKRVRRSGWWVLGVDSPESVADHSFRCAVIAYIIAKIEGIEPYEPLVMALFNDIHESRIGDAHKMAQRYLPAESSEDAAFAEQIRTMPSCLREELSSLRLRYRAQRSPASIIARDADILECLIQAKEYYEYGYKQAVKFMRKAPRHLKSGTARSLWESAKRVSLNDWWHSLSEFKR